MIEQHAITDRKTWLQWRSQDLTASDIGAAAGVDRYRSPLRIFREKRGEVPAQEETGPMRRGRWLEPGVLFALREQHPTWHIMPAQQYLRDTENRLGCSPDAYAWIPGEDGVVNVQLKVVSRFIYDRDWPGINAPLSYILQTVCEGMLIGATRSLLVALVDDGRNAFLAERTVPRYPDAEQTIKRIAVDFWAAVEAGKAPPADYSKDAETINGMFPTAEPGTVVDLSGDNRLPELLVDRALLKAQAAEAEKRVDTIDAEIKDKLGAIETATLPGWRLTWKNEVANYKAQEARTVTTRKLRVTEQEPAP